MVYALIVTLFVLENRMKIAIISDIHGNATALDAVLSDIKNAVVDKIVCLGDALTLGPSPRETLETLRHLNCLFAYEAIMRRPC